MLKNDGDKTRRLPGGGPDAKALFFVILACRLSGPSYVAYLHRLNLYEDVHFFFYSPRDAKRFLSDEYMINYHCCYYRHRHRRPTATVAIISRKTHLYASRQKTSARFVIIFTNACASVSPPTIIRSILNYYYLYYYVHRVAIKNDGDLGNRTGKVNILYSINKKLTTYFLIFTTYACKLFRTYNYFPLETFSQLILLYGIGNTVVFDH